MNELIGLAAWLVAAVQGDATMGTHIGDRVFEGAGPQNDPDTEEPLAHPFLVYNVQTSSDNLAAFGERQQSKAVLNLRLAGTEGYAALQAACDRLDALITVRAPVAVTFGGQSYTLCYCIRRRPVMYSTPPDKDDVRYYYLGGLYEAVVRPA